MRSISWRTYAAAFVISAFLFTFGIMVGLFLTQGISQQLEQDLSLLQSHTNELEVLLLSDTNKNQTLCQFYQSTLKNFDDETTGFGVKLESLENTRGRLDSYVQRLKRDYMLKQVRDFLLIKHTDQQCKSQTPTLLYFYTNSCLDCTKQGLVGPSLKKTHPELMIYAFDVDLNTTLVQAFQQLYGINSYPSVVLNGNTFTGYQSQDTIESLLVRKN